MSKWQTKPLSTKHAIKSEPDRTSFPFGGKTGCVSDSVGKGKNRKEQSTSWKVNRHKLNKDSSTTLLSLPKYTLSFCFTEIEV